MTALKARRGATAHAKCRADSGCSSPPSSQRPQQPPGGPLATERVPVTLTPSVSGGQLTEHAQLHGRPCFPEYKPQLPCSSPSPCTALPHRRRTARALCWLLSRTTVAQVVGAARIGGSHLSPLRSPLCKHHDLPTTPQWPFRLFSSLAITNKAPPHGAARLWMRTNAPFCQGQTQEVPTQLSKAALLVYTPPALGTATLLTCSPPAAVCSRTLSLTSGDNGVTGSDGPVNCTGGDDF